MPLVELPHPALMTVSQPVYHYDPDLPELIADMKRVMSRGGVGLAANQVGVTKCVITTTFSPDIALNPAWRPHRKSKLVKDSEGCLSDPFRRYRVERHDFIIATWMNMNGEHLECRLRDLQARIWQHECDHLMGVNIRDKGGERLR